MSQLEILGVRYPPLGDWVARVTGTWLLEDQSEALVEARVRGNDHPMDTAWRVRVRR